MPPWCRRRGPDRSCDSHRVDRGPSAARLDGCRRSRTACWEESDRSVAKPGRRRAIHEERNAGYPVRRTAAMLGIGQTERSRGLHLFDLPCSGRLRRGKGGHAADPCGSRPQQVAASRRETVQFPIPPRSGPTAIHRDVARTPAFRRRNRRRRFPWRACSPSRRQRN